MAEQTPDSIITTQRNGQTIVVELFFNHSSTETFRDKLLKLVLADSSRLSASDSQEPGKTPEKCSYCVTGAQKGEFMRTGLTKQEKTTDIWFDKKDPLIHIRTHNTDLKRRLAAYAKQYHGECCKTDTDPETGCMEFDIAKGCFSFRLTAPYSEERQEAVRQYARDSNAADRLKYSPSCDILYLLSEQQMRI